MQITDGSITEYHEGYTVENKLFTYSEEERQEQEINKMNAELILKPQFIPVNPKMLQDGYSPMEAMIYGFMSFFLSNNDKFYCTNEQLAKMLNTSEKTVSLAINKLKEKGLINISYKMRAGGGKTRFVHLATLQKVMSDFTKCNVATLPKHTNIENKEIENNTIDKKEYKEKFEEFWKTYPHARKGKKSESYEHFIKQNIDDVMLDAKLLKRQVIAGLKNPQYIPACERWIRDYVPINDAIKQQIIDDIMKRHKTSPVNRFSEIVEDFKGWKTEQELNGFNKGNAPVIKTKFNFI